MIDISHADLVRIAVDWLKRPESRGGPGCTIAFSEVKNGYLNGEIPDALGFRAGVWNECSVLVEAKTTRADFLADSQKPFRIEPDTGLGMYRYFIAPAGMIALDELPPKWGLIEVNTRGTPKVVHGHLLVKRTPEPSVNPFRFASRNHQLEIALLVRMLRRIGDLESFNLLLKKVFNREAKHIKHIERLQNECDAWKARYYEKLPVEHPIPRQINNHATV